MGQIEPFGSLVQNLDILQLKQIWTGIIYYQTQKSATTLGSVSFLILFHVTRYQDIIFTGTSYNESEYYLELFSLGFCILYF